MSVGIKALVVAFAILVVRSAEAARRPLTPLKKFYKVACIAENLKGTEHFICDLHGRVICLPGWSDETKDCKIPVCRHECIPGQGKCTAADVCTCEVGWTGPSCSECVRLPGCKNGKCAQSFECNCNEGWTGMFCDKPKCKKGCVNGDCSSPGECLCNPGWFGENCDQCLKLPGCSKNGYCDKPMSCKCKPGYGGNHCLDPICSAGCHPEYGFCSLPNVCWCHPGWTGQNCTECVRYPGCVNGTCEAPWECKCLPGFSGRLCNIESEETRNKAQKNPKFFEGFPNVLKSNASRAFDFAGDELVAPRGNAEKITEPTVFNLPSDDVVPRGNVKGPTTKLTEGEEQMPK